MGIFDSLKKKTPTQAAPAEKPVIVAEKKPAAKKSPASSAKVPAIKEKTVAEEINAGQPAKSKVKLPAGVYAHHILLVPVISEKSAHLNAFNQYVFKVSMKANKVSIKKAVLEAYQIEPKEVRIMKIQGKEVRRGNKIGRTKMYKKAIVTMPKGTSLPIYEGV